MADNQIFLSWSDDGGLGFGNPIGNPIAPPGAPSASLQWQRLGMGRRRVFALEWAVPALVVLQGAWVDATPARS
jgi:hypothetical protein